MILSLDTETTGLDFRHGCAPYFVTFATEEGENIYFEWDVDPTTRDPVIDRKDLREIQDIIDDAEILALQNTKFDLSALQVAFQGKLRWNWSKVFDTLLAAHLLDSGKPKDLTSLSARYLKINVKPYEQKIRAATMRARHLAKKHFSSWQIAKAGNPKIPSARGEVWKYDMWLPKQVALALKYEESHEWLSLCEQYANTDSLVTVELAKLFQAAGSVGSNSRAFSHCS